MFRHGVEFVSVPLMGVSGIAPETVQARLQGRSNRNSPHAGFYGAGNSVIQVPQLVEKRSNCKATHAWGARRTWTRMLDEKRRLLAGEPTAVPLCDHGE